MASAVSVRSPLPPCDLGAVELLTFFPNHTQWPEAGLRLYRNGWSSQDIADTQLYVRGGLNNDNSRKRTNAMRHQVALNGKTFFGDTTFKQRTHGHLMTAVSTYNASGYAARPTQTVSSDPERLVDVARGVVHWPSNEDRGIVTQCIDHALTNGLVEYTTADIPRMAATLAFAAPSQASTPRWDQGALQRMRKILG
jgi:hypothetical protein